MLCELSLTFPRARDGAGLQQSVSQGQGPGSAHPKMDTRSVHDRHTSDAAPVKPPAEGSCNPV